MKKSMKRAVIKGAILLLIIGYFTMTQIGALRLAIIVSGHPIRAFSFELQDRPNYVYAEENQEGFSLVNPPVEAATQGELVNWIVTKHGIFYSARYYGWG